MHNKRETPEQLEEAAYRDLLSKIRKEAEKYLGRPVTEQDIKNSEWCKQSRQNIVDNCKGEQMRHWFNLRSVVLFLVLAMAATLLLPETFSLVLVIGGIIWLIATSDSNNSKQA